MFGESRLRPFIAQGITSREHLVLLNLDTVIAEQTTTLLALNPRNWRPAILAQWPNLKLTHSGAAFSRQQNIIAGESVSEFNGAVADLVLQQERVSDERLGTDLPPKLVPVAMLVLPADWRKAPKPAVRGADSPVNCAV